MTVKTAALVTYIYILFPVQGRGGKVREKIWNCELGEQSGSFCILICNMSNHILEGLKV
jgi:hypothetical protein